MKMLTDMIAEEFEMKEEEQWYEHRDLEHDLHLAAELGKTLLERNHELEEGLQEMYTTNQEQLQEIEHLSKQVEMLRSVNDQHAKVYEQLDATARDLEQSNQRLALENRSDQLKIEGLTDTINELQSQVEELQRKIEKLTPDLLDPEKPVISQSDKYPPSEHFVFTGTLSLEEDQWEEEEDHFALLHSLQAELHLERTLRETAEHEAEALAREISELEPRVTLLEAYKARLTEVEAEVEELRQLVRSDSASRIFPGALNFYSEEDMSQMWETRQALRCSKSERQMLEAGSKDEELRHGEHMDAYRGHLEAVESQGMSLLNEVDAQYSALESKYNALLRHCEDLSQSRVQCDKAVQTSTASQNSTRNPDRLARPQNHAQLPEYKVLFSEIFTYIQKSKKDLNRAISS
ncbi:cerebellar degeneration-related protein 2 [Silurus asotus]|uniref:Cerebellar degeneration-related protein 2 n=1 Tax=Silurus asotus TaxID=30991 RepID=A0AAD5FST6_SILAS|nr:cerebellar degeneration-related protein 2 [Silurus asotus]